MKNTEVDQLDSRGDGHDLIAALGTWIELVHSGKYTSMALTFWPAHPDRPARVMGRLGWDAAPPRHPGAPGAVRHRCSAMQMLGDTPFSAITEAIRIVMENAAITRTRQGGEMAEGQQD